MPASPAVLCLAHLAWDFVWQRPQHILSRIARSWPVLYVDEPRASLPAGSPPRLKPVAREDGVAAWQPLFPPTNAPREWRAHYWQVVRDLLLAEGWVTEYDGRMTARRPLVLWFYTPIPYYFVDLVPAAAVVYDVMDEFSGFKGAAADLPEREAALLARADVVFAGGRSIHEYKRQLRPEAMLFPSGVDAAHFAQALDGRTSVAPELAGLPRPVLGYYGVIDERIDLPLLARLAAAEPAWTIAMVGPVRKIDEDDLPCASNIHYFGQQSYERLPAFLKGFDVCLMPFAGNAATRRISPTKALEYMAAHKPVVSSPVPDVVANWSEIVWIADSAAGFAGAVREILTEPFAHKAERARREREVIARNGWDGIAAQMQQYVEKALGSRPHAASL